MGCSSVSSRAQLGCQLSAHLATLPYLLSSAVPLEEELGTGDSLDFLPCVGTGARIPWPHWGAAQMMGILSCSVWGGSGELSLLWKRILQAAAAGAPLCGCHHGILFVLFLSPEHE